nr:hypothetical protein [Kofleriaceae bacterium]
AYLRDADLVFTDGAIDFVGRGYAGHADTVIDGRGRMVIPGLVLLLLWKGFYDPNVGIFNKMLNATGL